MIRISAWDSVIVDKTTRNALKTYTALSQNMIYWRPYYILSIKNIMKQVIQQGGWCDIKKVSWNTWKSDNDYPKNEVITNKTSFYNLKPEYTVVFSGESCLIFDDLVRSM